MEKLKGEGEGIKKIEKKKWLFEAGNHETTKNAQMLCSIHVVHMNGAKHSCVLTSFMSIANPGPYL